MMGMEKKQYLLGIDAGTYESKGVLVGLDGTVAVHASVPHTVSMPSPGWAEHDGEGVWWKDCVALCSMLFRKSGIAPESVLGVGVSAIAPCVLPLDGSGNPLRPGILYGIDTRASEEIRWIESLFGRDRIFEHSGFDLSSQHTGPKILWIKRHEPDLWKKTEMILSGSSYLAFRLTGEYSIDQYTATAYAPMYDPERMRWSETMSDPIVPVSKLPRIVWPCEVVGRVTARASAETGLAAGTPVIAGTADAASEAVSAGLSKPGDLMIMYGSSIFIILQTKTRITSRTLWGVPFLEHGTFAVTGGMTSAGSLTRWFRDEFAQEELRAEKAGGENAYAALSRLAGTSVPGSHGLVVLPYFYGERTPIHDPDARGVVFGLTLKHSRADVYRALLESIGYGIRHIVEEVGKENEPPKRILAVGGGVNNPLLLTIVSDITGLEQTVPLCRLGACYGDAFMAGVGIGLFKGLSDIGQWVRAEKIIPSDPGRHSEYRDYYSLYRDLYANTAELMHRISGLQRNVMRE